MTAAASPSTAGPTSPGIVTVSINPSGPAAGDYYGQVRIAANVDNSPQTVSIVLSVAAAGVPVRASVLPTGLVFVGQVGGTTLPIKPVTVSNPNPSALTYSTAKFYTNGNNWFNATPATGTVAAAGSATINVQPNVTGLAAGIYLGELRLLFGDNTDARVQIVLVVTSASSNQQEGLSAGRDANCTPTKLQPVFTQLG